MVDGGDGGRFIVGLRERFLAGEQVTGGVRSPVLASWQRCRALGLAPDHLEPPYQADLDHADALLRAADPVLDRLQGRIAGTWASVALTDAQGFVLRREAGHPQLARSIEAQRRGPGFTLAERFAGTNGVGVALAGRRPAHVRGHEHFAELLNGLSCISVPIRHPLSGSIVGVLDLSCPSTDFSLAADAVMRTAALAVERRLLEQSAERERALLEAYVRVDREGRPAVPVTGSYLGATPPPDSHFARCDHLLLQEMAAPLIASGRKAAIEVALSHGRVVTLVARPVGDPFEGVVVEALLPGGPPQEHLAVGPQGPPAAAAPAGAGAGAGAAAPAYRWPLAVGEPAVGRYAVVARQRLELLSEAGVRIGTTLDVTRTAGELAEVTVPRFADHVSVDLYDSVLEGGEPAAAGAPLRRTASHGIGEDRGFFPVGERITPAATTPQANCLAPGASAVLVADLTTASGWSAQESVRADTFTERGVRSLIAAPVVARGAVLGVASFYRAGTSAAFEDDDVFLAEELAGRAAVSIDNARRYTRERTMALTLQRSLLPRGLPGQNALDVAHRYLPAQAGAGGDWFDVIPLSGARVALVVGDVVGRGVHAAATMGRLRTAVHNFAAFDLEPDELLAHLDALVDRIDREEGGEWGDGVIGATCLYAVYDPTSGRCTLARAGHPPPALIDPGGAVSCPELPAGPPLGLGGFPFESAELVLPENSRLILYTDGLISDRKRGMGTGLQNLHGVLARSGRGSLEHTCQAVTDALVPDGPGDDDVTLLAVRTRTMDPRSIARWDDLPSDPAVVSRLRAEAVRKLADWGMEEAAFTTELILSELLTNAIRYGKEPVGVRLLRDRTLICEVSDGSSTSPHLRQADATDEGGRGLFLVAQMARRWGTRYTSRGKVIWAEQ